MPDLSDFPVTRRWPARYPDRLQYYSLATPNGVKVSIMLEETGLPYEAHRIDFGAADQHTPEFTALNPNGKIPAILDPDGPDGNPLALAESGAILLYLAEKTGQLMPAGATGRWRAMQWLMFQMSGIGPMFGQVGFFLKFAGKDWPDKRPQDRYVAETRRLLGVMDSALRGSDWFLGRELSVVDISMIGSVHNLITFYGGREIVGFDDFANVNGWLDRALSRPAVQRGLAIL